MARVNLDGKVWKDPRVKRLAKRRSWSVRETIGTLAAVWDVAYDNKTPIMRRIDVDTAAESDGFADDMLAEDLAEPIADDLISVRLRGVRERIQYLIDQAERGRRGGQARAASAERSDDGRLANAKQSPGEVQANACHSLSPVQADSKQPPDLPLAPDLDPDLALPLVPALGLPAREPRRTRKQPRRAMPADWTPNPRELLKARKLGLDGQREAERFRNHHKAHGSIFADWDAAFGKWLDKGVEFAARRADSGRAEPHPPSAYPEGRQEL